MHLFKIQFIGLIDTALLIIDGCVHTEFDSHIMKASAEQLKEISSFPYPIDEYFRKIPVTETEPLKSERKERHHTAEDSFVPLGTPGYASDFRITTEKYNEREVLDEVIRKDTLTNYFKKWI